MGGSVFRGTDGLKGNPEYALHFHAHDTLSPSQIQYAESVTKLRVLVRGLDCMSLHSVSCRIQVASEFTLALVRAVLSHDRLVEFDAQAGSIRDFNVSRVRRNRIHDDVFHQHVGRRPMSATG